MLSFFAAAGIEPLVLFSWLFEHTVGRVAYGVRYRIGEMNESGATRVRWILIGWIFCLPRWGIWIPCEHSIAGDDAIST